MNIIAKRTAPARIAALTLALATSAFLLAFALATPAFAATGSTVQQDNLANSWRYVNGALIVPGSEYEVSGELLDADGEGAEGSREGEGEAAAFEKWSLTHDGYVNSFGDVIPGAIAKGIDVSEWNGLIDWEAVRADGITFAIIRCGYGNNIYRDDLGEWIQDDDYWEYNVSECERLGIAYGVYLYSYAENADMAASEARHVLRLVEGHDLSLPIYYDLEETRIAEDAENPQELFAELTDVFCGALEDAGYETGVYANLNWWNKYLTDEDAFGGRDRWVAQYNYRCDYEGDYRFWQCTSGGSVDGIEGRVDVNFELRRSYPGDVAVDDWYVSQGAYDFVTIRGIMGGYEDTGLFGPYDDITRGQVVTILWRMAGCPKPAASASFADVDYGEYYGDAIRWAVGAGVVSGYRNADGTYTTFGPDDSVTREQLAVMLRNYASEVDGMDASGNAATLASFPDAASVSDWARDGMAWAVDAGILSGIEGEGALSLAPRDTAWRASVAAMVQRYDVL